MCQSYSTRPQPIPIVPIMQKSSERHNFKEIPKNSAHIFLRYQTALDGKCSILFSQCQQVPGAYLGQILTQTDTSKSSTPKMGRGREIELRRIKNGRLGLDSIVQISDISPVVTDNVWIKLNSFLLFSSFSCRWIKRARTE